MAKRKYNKEEVIADWKTGKYTERDIASMHKISPATAHNIVKGVERDALPSNRVDCSITPIPTIVYIITTDEYAGIFKIGITNDIQRRLRDMQTACPFMLFAFRSYTVINPMAVEAMLHSFFHKKRLCGEWFKLNATDLQYIDEAMCVVDEVVNGKH